MNMFDNNDKIEKKSTHHSLLTIHYSLIDLLTH